jgi:hypothetical protein
VIQVHAEQVPGDGVEHVGDDHTVAQHHLHSVVVWVGVAVQGDGALLGEEVLGTLELPLEMRRPHVGQVKDMAARLRVPLAVGIAGSGDRHSLHLIPGWFHLVGGPTVG